MADYFYNEDEEEDPDGGFCENEVPIIPDDFLPPVVKLEKNADSTNIFNRQVCARTLLETLRATDVPEGLDVERVFDVMKNLADDVEPTVRAELMEQVPHIAMYCQEYKSKLAYVIPQNLLPMIVKFLTDANNQVRKMSQAALLVLLEQGLVDKVDVEEQVCPVILRLTEADSIDDYRTEAVALLSKMAPLIGKEMSEKIFLERFAALCSDSLLHVRKVCAANFGDFSSVVGSEATEQVLLPKFFYLCEDGVWGVRKACADVFMPVSCVCSASVRQNELSPLFINLLRDQSRWVRIAAFQALGPFISTFADPSITALLHNSNGEIVITDPDQLAARLNELEEERMREKEKESVIPPSSSSLSSMTAAPIFSSSSSSSSPSPSSQQQQQKQPKMEESFSSSAKEKGKAEERLIIGRTDLSPEEIRASKFKPENDFNSFLYWREPVQAIDLPELKTEDCDFESDSISSSFGPWEDPWADMIDPEPKPNRNEGGQQQQQRQHQQLERKDGENLCSPQAYNEILSDPCLPKGPPRTEQNIVPQLLIDHFVSMIDPSRAQTIDNEITRHCAFSLPAVALTLGRSNWPLLKDTYDILAADMQWTVRRTLASSIHELGIILGEDRAGQDLIPIFNDFIKDLDEVRIGILKHLADFVKLLKPELRRDYLPRLAEFLTTYNKRNWRFREELTIQIGKLVPLYSVDDVKETLAPIALHLAQDKVAAVRQSAIHVLASIIRCLSSESLGLCRSVLLDLTEHLADPACRWVHRQAYAVLSYVIVSSHAMPMAQFAADILPHLLSLASDQVPNVRLAVARVLAQSLFQNSYLNSEANPHYKRMLTCLSQLQKDPDTDVRYLANSTSQHVDVSSLPV